MRTRRFLIALLLCVFAVLTGRAQLTDFSLSLGKVDELCPGNGSISINITGATVGSTFLYFIYKLPDETNPLALIDETVFEGLSAGTYKIVAVQSLGVQTNTQVAFITINPVFQPLIFSVTGAIPPCSVSGSITVTATQGAVATYQIVSGPVTTSPQATGVFPNLPQGSYSVKVTDNCGFAATMDYSLVTPTTGLTILQSQPKNESCSQQLISGSLSAANAQSIAPPVQLTCVIHPPNGGADIVLQQTVTSTTFNFLAPFFPGENYTYDLFATNACGDTAQIVGFQALTDITPKVMSLPAGCLQSLNFSGATGVTLVSAPPDYSGPVPYVVPPGTQGAYPINNAVVGNYTFLISDICGEISSVEYTVEQSIPVSPVIDTYAGCGASSGSVRILSVGTGGVIQHAEITAAPATFQGALPFDVTFAIVNGSVYLGDLPTGSYAFHVTTVCGGEFDLSVVVNGVTISNFNYQVDQGCGIFDLFMSATVSAPNFNIFYIQKLNPVTGLWTHPFTNVAQQPGQGLGAGNAYGLTNGGITPNFFVDATYRILNQGLTWQTANSTLKLCWQEITQFTVEGVVPNLNAYVFGCNNGLSDVLLGFNGIAPYSFRIIQRNNLPYVVENGDSPIFTALTPGLYTFEATDACGNVYNTTIGTVDGFGLPLFANVTCENSVGTLSTPFFDFFEYKWWKGNNEANVLSNSSVLTFPSLSSADFGTYHLRVTFNANTSSCINFVTSYTLNSILPQPKAGTGNSVSSCTSGAPIDLFSLLQPPFDNGGTWVAITPGDTINGGTWTPDSSSTALGEHAFQYTVVNGCGTASTVARIVLLGAPATPTASTLPLVCEGSDLYLFSEGDADVTYIWEGPNGFQSSDRNPILTDVSADAGGVYTLVTKRGDCESGMVEVAVEVSPLPRFAVNGECQGAQFQLTAAAESAQTGPLSFTWSGPDGYVGEGDSVTAPKRGTYTIVASDVEGCSLARNFDVASIVCEIPKGISPNDDGKNDSFDLSGLGVRRLEILNRYGTVVFDKLNYLNEWRGQDYNGNLLPTATYFYYIEFEEGGSKAGWVYLTRN